MASVYIPVQGTEEEVRVALDQLPHDASDILDILKAEQAPLHLWLIIAVTFPLPISLMLAVPRISQGSLGLFGLLGILMRELLLCGSVVVATLASGCFPRFGL